MNDFVVFLFLYLNIDTHFTFFISLIPFSYQQNVFKKNKRFANNHLTGIYNDSVLRRHHHRLKWFPDNIDEMRLLTMNNE